MRVLSLCGFVSLLATTSAMHMMESGLPAPQHVLATQLSPTSLRVSWEEPPYPVMGYLIYYSMFSPKNIDYWPYIEVEAEAGTSADLHNLREYRVYDVRVQAIILGGEYSQISPPVGPDVPSLQILTG